MAIISRGKPSLTGPNKVWSPVADKDRVTPPSGLLEELQDKKDRMKRKLMESESDEQPEYREKKKVNLFLEQKVTEM